MRRYTKTLKSLKIPSIIALFAILFQNVFPIFLMNPFGADPVYADPGQISSIKYFLTGLNSGQNPNIEGSWTNGNLCDGTNCYDELDEVPHRLRIDNLDLGLDGYLTGYVVVRVEHQKNGIGAVGYSHVSGSSPVLPHVGATGVTVTPYTPLQSSCGSDTCNNYRIDFTANQPDITLYFDSVLGADSSEYSNGGSLHTRLYFGLNGDDNIGDQAIPLGVNMIHALPSLSLSKSLTGLEGTATPADWCFDLSGIGRHCIREDGDGVDTVTIDNLTGTSYTVTEDGPEGYEYLSVTGDNCVAQGGGVAIMSVAPGKTPTNASCNFTNQQEVGDLKVLKDVVGPNGEALVDNVPQFEFTASIGNGEVFTLRDEESKVWTDIPAGEYTITETNIPENYDLYSYSIDESGIDGAQVTVVSGQETELTVKNNQVGGSIHVHKYVLDPTGEPANDPSPFFGIDLNGSDLRRINDGGVVTYDKLIEGTYTITEVGVPSGYLLSHFDGDEDSNSPEAQVSVGNGQEKHLSIYNKQVLSGLLVEKTDDVDTVNAGEGFEYTITAQNEGPHTLHKVNVADKLPVPFQLVSVSTDFGSCTPDLADDSFTCEIGDLADSVIATIKVEVEVPHDAEAKTYENIAKISAYEYPEGVDAAEKTDVVTDFDLGIEKTATVDRISAGDPSGFDYKVVVENKGPSGAAGVVLTDSIPAVLHIDSFSDDDAGVVCTQNNMDMECVIGFMAPGQKYTLTVNVSVPSSVSPTKIRNIASANSGDILVDDYADVEIENEVDLRMKKEASTDVVKAGEGFVYTITLGNGGSALSDATRVILTDTIPAPFVALGVDNTDCNLTGNDLRCGWRNIAPGAGRIIVNVRVAVPTDASPDTIRNTAYLSSNEAKLEDFADVEIVEESSIYVRKNTSDDRVTAGGRNFIYTLEIGNDGPSNADDVELTDFLPTGLLYHSYRIESRTNSFSCDFGDPVITPPSDEYVGRQGFNCDVGDMKPGDVARILITSSAPNWMDAQRVINRVDVRTSDGDSDNATVELAVVEFVDLKIRKVDDYLDGEKATPGVSNVEYSISLYNDGHSTADNVFLRDVLPAEFEFVSAPDNCIYESSDHTVVCKIGNMDPKSGSSIKIVVFVPDNTPSGNYENVAVISSDEDRERDNEFTEVEESTKLRVIKTLISDNPMIAGTGNLIFKIQVVNQGPSIATDVYMVDDLSAIIDGLDTTDDFKLRVSPDIGTCDPVDLVTKTLRCDFGDMSVFNRQDGSGVATVTIGIDIPSYFAQGRYENRAMARSSNGGESRDNEIFGVVEQSNLRLEKIVTPESIISGIEEKTVTYSIKVTNEGPSDADNTMVMDRLPMGFTMGLLPDMCKYVGGDLIAPAAGPVGLGGVILTPIPMIECYLGTLKSGEMKTISFNMTVPKDIQGGIYTNYAMAGSDECVSDEILPEIPHENGLPFEAAVRFGDDQEIPTRPRICARDSAEVDILSFDLIKYDDYEHEEAAIAGTDEVLYTITFEKYGSETDKYTEIVDYLPAGFSFRSVSDGRCQYHPEDHSVRCRFSGLDNPFEVISFQIRTFVEHWVERGYHTNNVELHYEDSSYFAEHDTLVGRVNDIQVDKKIVSVDGEDVSDNYFILPDSDDVVFVSTVTNYGPSIATEVHFVEDFSNLAGMVNNIADLNVRVDVSQGFCNAPDLTSFTADCYLGDMAPGEGPEYVLLTVDIPDYVIGDINYNYVCVESSETGYGRCVEPVDRDTEVGWADRAWFETVSVSVDKSDDVDPVNIGEEFAYSILVKNYGRNTVDNVLVYDEIPTPFEVLSVESTNAECKFDSTSVKCSLGSMVGDEEASITLNVRVLDESDPGIYENIASVYSSDRQIGEAGEETEVLSLPRILITKTNSYVQNPREYFPGEVVSYNLLLEILDAPIDLLTINDVIPQGLTYVEGSLVVETEAAQPLGLRFARPLGAEIKYVNGVAQLVVTDLSLGDKVSIVYKAVVDGDAIPGLLKDVSWAKGLSRGNQVVYADAVEGNSSYLAANFVGTEVLIGQLSEVPEEGVVLGASTETLPTTGIASWKTLLALISIMAGTILLGYSYFGSKPFKFDPLKRLGMVGLFTLIGIIGIGVFSVSGAHAISIINLSAPSDTSSQNFNIPYTVATDHTGTTLVSCEVKVPGTSNFVTFGNTDTFSGEIGTGTCEISKSNASVDGVYQFRAVGSLVGSTETIPPSNVVSIRIDTTKPSTPPPSNVEETGICTNTITTTIPNDPDIVKLEIFRSSTTSFTAGSTTLITTLNVTPGQSVSYTDVISNCSGNYYYATRTVDGIGNTSTVVGENTTIAEDVNNTGNAVVVAQPVTELVTIDQGDNEEVLGEVLGEETDEDPKPELIGADEELDEVKEVISENDNDREGNDAEADNNDQFGDILRKYWIVIILGFGLLGIGGYIFYQSRQSKSAI